MARIARHSAPRVEIQGWRHDFLTVACDCLPELLPSLAAQVFEPWLSWARAIHARLPPAQRAKLGLHSVVSDGCGLHRPRAAAFDDVDFTELIDPTIAHHQPAAALLSTRRPNGAGLRPFLFIAPEASVTNVFEVIDEADPRQIASWGTRRLTGWLQRWHLPSHLGSQNWARVFFRETMRTWVIDPNSRFTPAAPSTRVPPWYRRCAGASAHHRWSRP